MRISTATDSLLTTPDGAANQDDADKGLFARLLQAQPESSHALPDAAAAKATAKAAVGEVKADTNVVDVAPPLAIQTDESLAPVATTESISEATASTVTAIASGAASTLAAASSKTQAMLAELVATLTQSAQASTATLPTSAEELVKIPTAEGKSAQAAAVTTNVQRNPSVSIDNTESAGSAETIAADDESSPKSSAPRSKVASSAHAAIQPGSNPATTQLPVASTTTTLLTTDSAKSAMTTSADAPQPLAIATANAVSTTGASKADGSAVNGQSLADPESELLVSPAADQSSPADVVNSNDTRTQRGLRLPPGGKSLPPSTDSTEESSGNSLQQAFKDLGAPLQNQSAADTTALQANQNALAAAASNPDSQQANTSQQGANSAPAPLPSLATNSISTTTAALPPAFVMSSSLAMNSSGWGEEALHHIRWLKDHDQQSAEIQLHPAELGRLSITIDIKDGAATVQLVAASAEAKELLEKALPDLRSLLAQNGMSLSDSGVAQHSGSRDTWPNRFNPPWFDSDELKPAELSAGKPAIFRSAGGSHRIDHYV